MEIAGPALMRRDEVKREKKSGVLFSAVTPGQRDRISELAAARGYSISAFIRVLVLRELRTAEQERRG